MRPVPYQVLIIGYALIALVLAGGPAMAEGDPFRLDPESIVGPEGVWLKGPWRYSSTHDPRHAQADFDDSQWSLVDPQMRRGALPDDWPGSGWFRLRLQVDPRLSGSSMALKVIQAGAAEIYLDGELLVRYGSLEVATGHPVETRAESPLASWLFHFDQGGEHLIAVRYAAPDALDFHRVGWYAGFLLKIGHANLVVPAEVKTIQQRASYLWFFTSVFLSFAMLHLLLFLFYPKVLDNLFFALFCLSSASLTFFLFQKSLETNPRFVLFSEAMMNVSGLLWGLFVLRFIYGVFYDKLPRWYTVIAVVISLMAIWAWRQPADSLPWVFLVMLAASLEMARAVIVALYRRKPGATPLGVGILTLAAGFTLGLLGNLGVLSSSWTLNTFVPFSSMVVLLVSMSFYLSHRFADTNRELRLKLVEVEELSRQKLQEERRGRRRELDKQLLEAELSRQAAELEEARELQLSMLPKRLPQIPELDIAAYMATATEVGGDYYDFHLADDGTLTIAIGDATGHGMRAGTMVTATKSLFNALGQDHDLLSTLNRSTLALKRLNLRKLAMALTLLQYKEGRLRLTAAGMPPVYIYRAASGIVDSVLLAGMPLGSFTGFPYREEEVTLELGDIVLLMSDGFPERLDPKGNLLGYDEAVAAFAGASGKSAQAIVDRLVKRGDDWAGGRLADDDTTFIVMKVRAPISPSSKP